MTAQYLVRFDDVCPTMNWKIWDRVEMSLDRHGVKPIVAIVPDNRDPKLVVSEPREDFWERARGWQARGWAIGLHGYQHRYTNPSGGIVNIHAGGEFAGHSVAEQRAKLEAGMEIFRAQGLVPEVWVAPGHAFDEVTVSILTELGIGAVSDGFYWRGVSRGGRPWLPQQLWRFRTMPFGLWTVCLHVNSWKDESVQRFDQALTRFATSMVTVDAVLSRHFPPVGLLDRAFASMYGLAVRAKLRGSRDH
jgi:peptidoglycan/xylan/chitin deacetylase (PgdA/CDA1 family)